ncbi:transcriptional regulator [Micromonospora sp. NPDC048909]|uniref:transcriptional regulator n=1 Tax=Micromonospora sp. NPDC048909 TaxID=3155643 RepID=UPI0033CA5A57
MPAREAPEQIARTRTVTADAVLGNRVDLRGYPYRLLSVVSHGVGGDRVTQAIAAAEVLETFGWELVTVSEFGSSRMVYAVLRRVAGPGPVGVPPGPAPLPRHPDRFRRA